MFKCKCEYNGNVDEQDFQGISANSRHTLVLERHLNVNQKLNRMKKNRMKKLNKSEIESIELNQNEK